MKRGDVITIAISGDYGKPRPAVVVQSDVVRPTDSIVVCPLTTTRRDAPLYRLAVPAVPMTGLTHPSYVMIDKIVSVRLDRCGARIGRVDDATLLSLSRLLAVLIGIADRSD